MSAQGPERTGAGRSPSPTPPRTRDRQTRRTKRALIAAAADIFREGRVPTVADVAERADVARATAYRYFPTQEALLLETTFPGDSEPLGALSDLVHEIKDPSKRVAAGVRQSAEWTLGREARLRAILRMSLDPDADVRRPARRRDYIAQLLDTAADELSPDVRERLIGSLTLLLGIDPIVSIRDNSDVPADRIPDVLAWAAQELVRSALAESRRAARHAGRRP